MHVSHKAAALAAVLLFAAACVGAGPAESRSGFVGAEDGVRIHYMESGTGGGPALLFVPGWTMPGWIWEHQVRHFSDTHRVVTMDPRSQGRSSQPAEGHYPAMRARDIKAVVDELKLAPVVLVGWSMGVTEVFAFVDQFGTDSVTALVLVDGIAGGEFDPRITPLMLRMAGSFQVDRRKATEGFVRGMYRKPQSAEYLERVVEASLVTPTNSALALFLGAMASDLRSAFEKIDKPALIVAAGAESPWMGYYREMQKRIRGSRLEIFEEAGHALFVDEAERFNALLRDFLRSAAARPGK